MKGLLTLAELMHALENTEELVKMMKRELPQLRVKVIASIGYGIASKEMSNLEIFKKSGSIFVKSHLRAECSALLAVTEKIESLYDHHQNKAETLNQIKLICINRINFLVNQMPIDESVNIELQLDEPDSDLVNWIDRRIKIYIDHCHDNSKSFSRFCIGRARELIRKSLPK